MAIAETHKKCSNLFLCRFVLIKMQYKQLNISKTACDPKILISQPTSCVFSMFDELEHLIQQKTAYDPKIPISQPTSCLFSMFNELEHLIFDA